MLKVRRERRRKWKQWGSELLEGWETDVGLCEGERKMGRNAIKEEEGRKKVSRMFRMK